MHVVLFFFALVIVLLVSFVWILARTRTSRRILFDSSNYTAHTLDHNREHAQLTTLVCVGTTLLSIYFTHYTLHSH